MRQPKAALVALLMFAATAVSSGSQSAAPWPPPFRDVPGAAPALSPEDEMKTFSLPPGYRVELVASEPMVEEPISIDWDSRGRMWVIELLGYMPDLRASGERQPTGRVSVLEDRDGDGRMDRKTVFLDGLVLPRALKVLEGGVLVAEPPHLWFVHDTNGDLKADKKELVCDCYGYEMGNVEHNANSFVWALDNWMYTSESEAYLRLKDGKFDVRKTLMRGQWGASQDNTGYVYRNISPEALHVDVVPTQYFFRNPNLMRTRGSDEPLGGAELNVTYPARPSRGVNRGYTPGQLRSDGSLANYTAAGAPTVYRGDRLPAELRGNIFVVEPAGNLVSRIILADTGRAFQGRKAYDKAEFLTSTDERFRPVNLSSAPDGTLYLVDMYRGIIQHMGYMTEYLRDNIVERHLETPVHKGRIYRIIHDTTRRGPSPSLATETAVQLVQRLSHPNGWWRDTAQRILVERGDKSAVPALNRLAESAPGSPRLHALWTLDGLESLQPSLVLKALDDVNRDVRVSAVRLAERWLGDPTSSVQAAVIKRIDDPDWAVRPQVAASLGALPAGQRETVLASMLARHGDDPLVVDASLSSLRGSEGLVLAKLLGAGTQTSASEAAIVMLTATAIRGRQEDTAQSAFRAIADSTRPMWQRAALLRGAEVALLGAPMPDADTPVTAPAPVPLRGRAVATGAVGGAGGGDAGPARGAGRGTAVAGSAPAFPGTRPRDPNGRPAPTGTLRLRQSPAIVSLASSDASELSVRAGMVLERVEWPGKPGVVAETPLTAEENLRFDAGRRVYVSVCQVCHQQDGRGQDKVAASLIGSTLALARPDVTVRILLHGKEGSIGLMPPVGASLVDDDIAAVLTYIRREWGQAGSAVDAATVRNVRAATAGRRTPWTNAELLELAGEKAPQR